MKQNPLRVLPSIRFTAIEINEAPMRHDYRVFDGALSIRAEVPSRDAPEHGIEICFGAGLPFNWHQLTDTSKAGWLRSQIMTCVGHEIDEMLFLAGLGKDPHAPKMRTFSRADVTLEPAPDPATFVKVPELEP